MEYYYKKNNAKSRWASFENPLGEKGAAAKGNAGAKGNACYELDPGETVELLNVKGSGIIHRIWMTFSNLSANELRSIRLECFWDQREKPAISVPVADFFCCGLSYLSPFENELFSSPEGRSFNSFVKMPFVKGARVELTNESDQKNTLFYDIAYTIEPINPENTLYFHAFWNRQNPTKLGKDYEVLPRVSGMGRYLGMNIGYLLNPSCLHTWFGEGEFKIYLDGDRQWPTMAGTGIEDFVGAGWGMKRFINRTQGVLLYEPENDRAAYYRLHTVDPIYFEEDIRVTVQQMGIARYDTLMTMIRDGAQVKAVKASVNGHDISLLEPEGKDYSFAHDWEHAIYFTAKMIALLLPTFTMKSQNPHFPLCQKYQNACCRKSIAMLSKSSFILILLNHGLSGVLKEEVK